MIRMTLLNLIGIGTILGLVSISAEGYATKGGTTRTYSSSTSTTSYTQPPTSSYTSHSYTAPVSGGYSSYSSWSSSSGHGGGGGSTPGFVIPSSGAPTSTYKSTYSSSGSGRGGNDAGFITPTTSGYTTSAASKGASNNGYMSHDRYSSSSLDDSATSFTSGGRGGIDALTPSGGYTNYGTTSKGGESAGFVNPGSHTSRKYSSSSSTSTTTSGGIDDGFMTPTTGHTNYGTRTSTPGFVIPSAPAFSATGSGQSGKYVSTTTTTTTTKGAPFNQYVAPEPLRNVPYASASQSSYQTAYANGNSFSNGGATNFVDKSKTKLNFAPVLIPTSGSSFSTNGHRTYYNTQYIYTEKSGSTGHGSDVSAEEQEIVGRLTAGGAEGTKPIILYEHTDHTGRGLVLSVPRGQCLDVPADFNDLTSSVNTYGHCFWLCEHSNCYGNCKKFAPGVGDHKYVGDLYNDHITSVKQC